MKRFIFLFCTLIIVISDLLWSQSVLDNYKRLTERDRIEIRRQKVVKFILPAMREQNVDLWITLTREYVQDPIVKDLGAGSPTARTALIFTDQGKRLGRTAIAASYDVDPLIKSQIYDTIISYKQEGLMPHLREFFSKVKPKKIAVNISKDSPLADGLTVSMLEYLKEALGDIYSDDKIVSAEPIIFAWRSKKLPREIEIIRVAVKATEEILNEALSRKVITPGKTTEKDVAQFIKDRMKALNVLPAWDPETCPSVNTKFYRGHSAPTDSVIKLNHILTIDFGINLDGYCTDLQRTAYILFPGATAPMPQIMRLFEVNVKALQAGFDMMRPGKTGYDVDTACRRVIAEAGYPDYPYASGHPIGYSRYDVGPILGPDWPERYGNKVFLKLEPNQVFALEPAVFSKQKQLQGETRIGLEEMVLITDTGPVWLSTPQTKFIYIESY